MMERYSDHAANERTFLAWIRTAIAVMAFGFLVERFDLFLQIAGQTLARHALSPGGQLAGNIAGLTLIALGAVTIVIAWCAFAGRRGKSTARNRCRARASGSTWRLRHSSSSWALRSLSICPIR
jgi:uncharacterized membrane protein YidH (DUF202 family)